MRSAVEHGCVLLFGGRQSGKTTVLRSIVADAAADRDAGSFRVVPVYIDLMRLPYDAAPENFFGVLCDGASAACALIIPEYKRGSSRPTRIQSLGQFEQHLAAVRAGARGFDVRFVFLLDESKRVIGDRFPRGFHDNLFHILYGDSGVSGVCSIVFAGAQELYRLCEDDTSPIGSRAAKHCVVNLTFPAVQDMTAALIRNDTDRSIEPGVSELVYGWTGGHAGLTSALIRSLRNLEGDVVSGVAEAAARLREKRSELFQLWSNSFTPEVRPVHDSLLRLDQLGRGEIGDVLRQAGLPVYRLDRVVDELQYVGIAHFDGASLTASNRLYKEQAALFSSEDRCSESERVVWGLIKEAETGLRGLVRQRFATKWGASADRMIETALGPSDWDRILDNRERHRKSYPRSGPPAGASDVLNYTYLGQLGQLMTWKKSWHLFKDLFRDLREFQDILRDITPVRNDSAHFRSVPEHELDRCRVRCVDLIAIIERDARSVPSLEQSTAT